MANPNDRISLSPNDIMKMKLESTPKEKWAELFPDYTDYVQKLYKAMQLPSYVHGYSLAIEYMRDWFLKKFPPNFFKTVYINGSHILDNWKNWNNYNIKREKPMLAIVPTLNYEWDRENLDMYMGDAEMILHQSSYDESFFKDYYNMSFLYLRLREMEMNFNFKIRVESKAQQLDLFNKMELWFRVGSTLQDNISADFHIPTDILVQMAKDAKFEIDEQTQLPKDIYAFINYMNLHSSAPIVFKMRAINQKPAFFIRARNLFTHIAIRDKISLDDGEREGKLETNYHLELQVRLRMPIPHFYAYMSEIPKTTTISIGETKPALGIYTINNYNIKPENQLGWPSILVTSYFAEPGETEIDISSLFESKEWPVSKVLYNDLSLGVSPQGFLDVNVFHNNGSLMTQRLANFHLDFKNMKIILDEEVVEKINYDIAIYADMQYVNSRLATIEIYDQRVQSDQTDKKFDPNKNK